jgi:glycosyltransferase involved in cell wall biosynthesis
VSRPAGGRPRVAHVATTDVTHRFLLLPQLRALRDAGYEVSAISAPGPWTDDLTAEGIRFVPWTKATRAWDLRADVGAFRELIGIFRRERFDVVHAHNPKPGIMARVAARVARAPAVLNTVHGFYAMPEDRLRRRLPVMSLEWAAARCSDVELYQSEEDLAWSQRLRIARPPKARHLGNGIDVGFFDPALVPRDRVRELRRELGLPIDGPVVGTVGRMVLEKGFRELFAAAATIRRSRPDVKFLVVGEIDAGKWDALDPTEVERAREDVVVAGWRTDIRDLLGAMDVFVLPSWREGMPRSAIEAAAMARPMVLTDIRGCREVAREGVEGHLVPVRDPASLAAAIERLLSDPAERARMGRAARARALERFDERRVASTVLQVTAELLRRKGYRVPAEPSITAEPG